MKTKKSTTRKRYTKKAPNKNKQQGQEVIINMVNDIIIERLEAGVIPWQKSWAGGFDKYGVNYNTPKNLITKMPYKGMNLWILTVMPYSSPFWLSYKQATDLGGLVKKGEKGTPIVFWKMLEYLKKDEKGKVVLDNTGTPKKTKVFYLRYSKVFNVEQCEGIDSKKIPSAPEPIVVTNKPEDIIPQAEAIINPYLKSKGAPQLAWHRGGDVSAWYMQSTDLINMPKRERFTSNEEYYTTLYHEAIHSTGHNARLKREGVAEMNGFGTKRYSFEELIAELGASYMAMYAGISNETIDNSASYIQSWLKKLKEDNKFMFKASSKAQKATDYIINIKNLKK